MKNILALSPFSLAFTTIGLLYLSAQTPERQLTQLYQSTFQASVVSADSNKLYLPDDLEATLWAESPMLYNPTNLDIDVRGRVWVTEAVNYRKFINKAEGRLNHPEGERVMILEDTNGDGKADNSKVFVQDPDLVSPLGIAVVGHRVIVSCAPNK